MRHADTSLGPPRPTRPENNPDRARVWLVGDPGVFGFPPGELRPSLYYSMRQYFEV